MFSCKFCEIKRAVVSCYYCPLTLYCSMTCAAIDQKKHPCHIASAIFRDQFIVPNAWNLFQDSLKDLEILFQFEISKEKFEDLLDHNICFSFFAIDYLIRRTEDFFIWPHQITEHNKWILKMSKKIVTLFPYLPKSNNIYNWSDNPTQFVYLLLPFSEFCADQLLNQKTIANFESLFFNDCEHIFSLLLNIVKHASIPFLYEIYYLILNLRATSTNCRNLFFCQQGKKIVCIPSLHPRSWQRARSLVTSNSYPLCTQQQWQNAKYIYTFFKKRRATLLNCCSEKNKRFVLNPQLQNTF